MASTGDHVRKVCGLLSSGAVLGTLLAMGLIAPAPADAALARSARSAGGAAPAPAPAHVSPGRAVPLLMPGSGYSAADGSPRVRSLQRRLERAAYPPGRVD